MWQESIHPSDRDLLLWVDGEFSPQRTAEMQRHLSACWTCRTRMAELEHTIADFVHLYHGELDGNVPPIAGPRALLKARMAEYAPYSGASSGRALMGMWQVRMAGAVAALLLLTGFSLGILRNRNLLGDSNETYQLSKIGVIPNGNLTPGATIHSSVRDVCNAISTNDPDVPDPLKREVLKEYGLTDVSNRAYEIDYLVTPQLGGAPNIRNLWPEPSLNTIWNARVKDALEDRLHFLVCSGQVDLTTAQREISHDWVAAYKKYFRTNEPLQSKSRAISTVARRSDVGFKLSLADPFRRLLPMSWRLRLVKFFENRAS
jgi:hypothetical protein